MSLRELFGAEVVRAFAFLVEAHGYTIACEDTAARLASAQLTWRVAYDLRSKALTTAAVARIDGRDVTADLVCLYGHAGLGPATRVPHLAVTGDALVTALLAHAAAVRELLPLLGGAASARLLLACQGR